MWEAMAGSTPPHSRICSSAGKIIENGSDGSRCNVFISDLKLSIHALRRYRYPDLSVVCGPLVYDEDVAQAITNPICLIEVAPASSKDADYTSKAKQYIDYVPTLRDYLVAVQDQRFVSLFSRAGPEDRWTVAHFSSPDDRVRLASIDVEVSLEALYHNIYWEDGKAYLGPRE